MLNADIIITYYVIQTKHIYWKYIISNVDKMDAYTDKNKLNTVICNKQILLPLHTTLSIIDNSCLYIYSK